jgi:hypothetical protein
MKRFSIAALTIFATGSLLLNARADISTGLVGYWKFDDGSGSSTAADSTTNGNNGTLTGFSDTTYTTMWTNEAWFGDAIDFNQNSDAGDYVSVTDAPSLNVSGTKAFTIAAWVNPSPGVAISSQGAILAKGYGGGGEEYCMDVSSSKFRVFFRNAAGTSSEAVSATTTISAGTWYHIVGTYNSSPSHEVIYVDGVSNTTATGTLTTVLSNNYVLSIGNRTASSTSGFTLPFKGIIDEVHIYNRTLTPSDVLQLYTNNGPAPIITSQPRNVTAYVGDTPIFGVGVDLTNTIMPITYQWQFDGTNITGATANDLTMANAQATNAGSYTVVISNYIGSVTSAPAVLTLNAIPAADTTTGLVGYWKFDDGSGSSSAADSSGHGNNGTLNGFSDSAYTTEWTGGLIGGALAFNEDGSDQNVVAVPNEGVPAPANLDFSTNGATGSAVFTLAAWVDGSLSQISGGAILDKGFGNGGEQYTLDIYNGHYRFYVRDSNGVVYTAQSTLSPSAAWQHVAAVLNGTNGTMNLYTNGILAAVALAPSSLLTNNHEVSIGNRQPANNSYGNAFTGNLDEVRIYNRALTSADVNALYQQGTTYPVIATSTPAASMPPVTASNVYSMFIEATNPIFSITATGSPTLSYQWYSNGVPISGATGTSLTLSNLTAGWLTNYCVAANSLGAATNTWWLDVVIPTAPYPLAVLADSPVGYWRLNEWDNERNNGNPGAVCNDYIGGHDGIYTNVNLGLSGYSQSTDPTETSAQFGVFATSNSYAGRIQGINFAAATGVNVNFSVECWANPSTTPGAAASLVTQGEYAVDDMFSLSFSSSSPYYYRFYAREVGVNPATVTGTAHPDGNWHHLVAVCNESAGMEVLYVDGVSNNSTAINTASGLAQAANLNVIIGAGTSTGVNYDKQSKGQISDVAIYNYALTAAQVKAHYNATGTGPGFTLPDTLYVNQGGNVTITATVTSGSPPLSYSWYDNNAQAVILGQTNAALVLNNITASDTYTLTVTNNFPPYSATGNAFVSVVSGGPQNPFGPLAVTPAYSAVYAGTPVTFSITAYGTLPLSYQWSSSVGGAISGATNSTYTATATVGSTTYTCTVSNLDGVISSSGTLVGVGFPTNNYALTILSNRPAAYWPLNEPDDTKQDGNPGAIAYDYVGGHDAIYFNVDLGVPGLNAANPETAALFGVFATSNSYAGENAYDTNVSPNIDFAQTEVGGNAEFSVEAWVQSTNSQTSGAGIVAKGYNSGGEQFVLDCSGNTYQFYFRDSAGSIINCQSGVSDQDGNWHYLVGVCDQLDGGAHFYVDGIDTADADTESGKGVADPTGASNPAADLVSIGSRAASKTDSILSDQFVGTIADVALYTNALTAAQVLAHYKAATTTPPVTLAITNLGAGNLQLNWSAGTLQTATNLAGPFVDVTNATPPYTISTTNVQQFYRLQE